MWINEILEYCVRLNASDLHIMSGYYPIVRVHGELKQLDNMAVLTPSDTENFVNSIITDTVLYDNLNTNGSIDFSYEILGTGRFRFNVYKSKGTYAMVARLIKLDIPTFEELNLPEVLLEFANLKKGLFLVTGQTGSGKSTTLASMIDYINTSRKDSIITLEDPIEYIYTTKASIVSQRELGIDFKEFSIALKAAMREDPDIILVGEMRDMETISVALTAAETGHVVFSTLHTTSASKTIDRIVDAFPPHQQQQIRSQIAATLEGVISQQLVPNVEGNGREIAYEILKATPAIKSLIRENKTFQIDSSIQTGSMQGMISMNNCLAKLVISNKIKIDVATRFSANPDELKRLIAAERNNFI